MSPSSIFRHLLVAGLIATLSACSSSDSDNAEPNESMNADNPSTDEQAVAETEAIIDDNPIDTIVDTTDESTENESTEDDSAAEEIVDVENTEEQSAEENNAGEGNTEEEPTESSVDDPSAAPDLIDDSDLADEEEAANALIPPVVAGSDLERIVQGLTRQVAITLLDLNQQISQGVMLTEQQDQCLGAYEEGLGEPLMAVNCDQPLATGEIALWVGEAAFYDTAACRQSLFNQGSEGCVLERMTLTIRTDWIPADSGNGPPTPAFPGALLAYGIDEPLLTLQSADSALTGTFSCNVNLETAEISSPSGPLGCDERVKSIADEIERLQNYSVSD